MRSGHGVDDIAKVGSEAESRIFDRIRPKPTPGQISGRIQREIQSEYVDFRLVLSFSHPPAFLITALFQTTKRIFFFFFWVSEIHRFDLHFMIVLGLDCDDSRLKDGVLKIFGFDL
jgi:hypothetical protein